MTSLESLHAVAKRSTALHSCLSVPAFCRQVQGARLTSVATQLKRSGLSESMPAGRVGAPTWSQLLVAS